MNPVNSEPLQLTLPRDCRLALGQWLRLARQRLQWTQSMLAAKSGTAVATISRLEREGEGSIGILLRVLQALGELDRFHHQIQDRLRQARLPLDLSEALTPGPPRQRIRIRRPRKAEASA